MTDGAGAPPPTPRLVATRTGRFASIALGAEDAPPVVYLHGFPDCPLTALDFLAAVAGAGYRVHAPWMRGYAPSTLDGPFHLEQLADDVEALAAALAPGRPVALLGHDWGALATHVAIARPAAAVRCAITLAVPNLLAVARRALTSPRQALASSYVAGFQLPGAATRPAARALTTVDELWRRWSPGHALAAPVRAALHRCLEDSWPAPIAYYRALVRPPVEALARAARLARDPAAKVPLLHLHGADDGCVHAAAAHAQAAYAAAAYECEVVGGVGHFLQQERPAAIAARARAWLARHHR